MVEARFARAVPGRHRLWSRLPPPGWPSVIHGMRLRISRSRPVSASSGFAPGHGAAA